MIKSDPRARLKPCLRCGYSLRNVPDARVCPECALPVWLTLGANDDLEMSNPRWLRRLSAACALLAAANLALVGGAAMVHVSRALWGTSPATVLWVFAPNVTALPWALAAYLALGAAGLLLLGTHEGRYPEKARPLRRTVLAGAALAAAFAAWLVAWQFTRSTRPPLFLLVVATCGQAAAGWMYLSALARRIPDPRRVRLFRWLAIALGIAVLSLVFGGQVRLLIAMVNPWSRYGLAWTLFLLIYPPLSAYLLARLALILRRAAIAADKNWGPDPSAAA